MKDRQRNLLRDVLSVQTASYDDERMRAFIEAFARRHRIGLEHHKGNLYLTKGVAKTYPCLVAHLDTVHDVLPEAEYRVHLLEGMWFAWDHVHREQVGIGGDDKVGIFIALQLLTELPAAKAAFFRDEEVGCRGAREARPGFFADCAFALEADRRGNADFVERIGDLELQSPAFREAVRPILTRFGYAPCRGLMTDVEALAGDHRIPIAMANLSCGYYRPHTDTEYVEEADVANALGLVRAICTELGDRRWPTERPERKLWYDWSLPPARATIPAAPVAELPWLEGEFADEPCPFCGQGDTLEFDETMDDWFCYGCGDYVGLPVPELDEAPF